MAERYDFYVHDNRRITFNLTEPIMREDSGVTDFVFHIPKVLNELEVSDWAWWLVFVNANKEKYSVALTLSDDPERPLEFNTATYTVDYAMSIKAGSVQFALEAINAGTGGAIDNEWHTLTYETKVKETLQGNQAEYAETESDIISALIQEVRTKVNQLVGGATPLPVSTISAMTDTSKLYLLTTDGEWYYYNGSAWVSGGVYGAGVTDSVPTQGSTNAVQSGGVKSALDGLQAEIPTVDSTPTQGSSNAVSSGGVYEALEKTPETATPEETEADFYLADENGNVLMELAEGHIRTKNFDSADIQTNGAEIKESSVTSADMYISDSFGNVIAEFINGHIRTKKFDSANFAAISSIVASLSSEVENLVAASSGIVARNKEAISGIYTSARYGFRENANYPANRFMLLIGGDIHGDSVRMNNHVDFLNALDCFDAGILLGDVCGNMWYDNSTYYTEAIARANKPFLTVVGNHDVQWQGSGEEPTQSAIYNKIIAPNIQYADLASGEEVAGKCYYFKDFADKKIRLIVLYQYDYAYNYIDNNESPYYYGYNCYQQAQIDWLISTLNSTPSDYAVIIANHSYPCRVIIQTNDVFTSNHYPTLTGSPSTFIEHTNGYIIEDIVNAWVTGGALSKTYNYTPTGWGNVTATADFTTRGTGEFIAFLGGHWHNSIISRTSQCGFLTFNIATASLSAGKISSDQARIAGERSEDSLVSFAVDRKNKRVNLFAVGAHWCDDTRDRLYASYSYTTE